MENKSISELEGWMWNEEVPNSEDSFVLRNFYRLHNIPIKNYSLADIRFMISQNEGLEYLVPIALNELSKNLFAEAELYSGDLLCSLFLINDEPNYWQSHKEEKQILINLYTEHKKMLGVIDISEELKQEIKKGFQEFIK